MNLGYFTMPLHPPGSPVLLTDLRKPNHLLTQPALSIEGTNTLPPSARCVTSSLRASFVAPFTSHSTTGNSSASLSSCATTAPPPAASLVVEGRASHDGAQL